jgi:hypothetical protein
VLVLLLLVVTFVPTLHDAAIITLYAILVWPAAITGYDMSLEEADDLMGSAMPLLPDHQ